MASRAAYAAHLQGTIHPSLAATREAIARVDADIADYEQVARRLSAVNPEHGSRKAPVEIGAGVWADAVVRDTSKVTLDLGLDVHFSLPTPQAAEYAAKRAEVLKRKRDALAQREERLAWEVEQFEGVLNAMTEAEQ
ncbi:uncharacterized protein EHS24_003552 [Apiotrichum porosum]|uniref:Uncharacterized protein n=1 Tax=Apiotrichum porosum TaxID=105984 RepID=A0A427XEV2_9TREE|nr:uncharacterized protein EHS24_003552 [Apiotrichum porosum]RSH77244.1 hypothetical protein EHS24_003552 [Apiotrichum porosum]